ncbi:MAG: NRDE family protein [Verrucomicrobiales bacterium]|nr:NRDE family protein [Verrucomicrobiales bacterium]
MCTVTFIARRAGYALGMNRDEQLTRATALPPAKHDLNSRTALFPCEPTGGTWVGVNDVGITFALVNWYAIKTGMPRSAVSRGEVVRRTLAVDSIAEADSVLAALPLHRMGPFRLIGIFPARCRVLEWRWDLNRLKRLSHSWQSKTWISSGFDEPGAQRVRGRSFHDALRQNSAGQLDWIRRLHRSHRPERGPYSTCMHRDDAATVSFTEVTVQSRKACMRYTAGPPCCTLPTPAVHLALNHH